MAGNSDADAEVAALTQQRSATPSSPSQSPSFKWANEARWAALDQARAKRKADEARRKRLEKERDAVTEEVRKRQEFLRRRAVLMLKRGAFDQRRNRNTFAALRIQSRWRVHHHAKNVKKRLAELRHSLAGNVQGDWSAADGRMSRAGGMCRELSGPGGGAGGTVARKGTRGFGGTGEPVPPS